MTTDTPAGRCPTVSSSRTNARSMSAAAFLPPTMPFCARPRVLTRNARRGEGAYVTQTLSVRRVREWTRVDASASLGRARTEGECTDGEQVGGEASLDSVGMRDTAAQKGMLESLESIVSRCFSSAAVVAGAFALVLGARPGVVLAREAKSVLTMTDRVSNFTLPSQEAALERERLEEERAQSQGILVKARKFTATVLPPAVGVVFVVWLGSRLMKRAQNRQLRQFQQQLETFSNNLNIPNLDSDTNEKTIPSQTASTITEDKSQSSGESDPVENVLELFRKGAESVSEAVGDAKNGGNSDAAKRLVDVELEPGLSEAERSWEAVILKSMQLCTEIRVKKEDNYEQVAKLLKDSQRRTELNDPVYRVITTRTVSHVVSSKIDLVINALVENKEAQVSVAIAQLSHALNSARIVRNNVEMTGSLRYVNTTSSKVLDAQVRMKELENVYRRYAMYCLSAGGKMTEELKALDELQRILEINDGHAEKINAEIASGMLQAAVAAASADANLSEADRRTLDALTDAFGTGKDAGGGGGQGGMSETAVLKMMQAIQQMMSVQDGGDGKGQDDVELLKNLCDELGVDFEEVIRNAEKFGDQYGATGAPDASMFGKEFTDKLKSALPAIDKEKGTTEQDK